MFISETKSPRSAARATGFLAVAAAALLAGGLWHLFQSPGQALRSALTAAAADMLSVPANLPPERLRRLLQQHFVGQPVTVDATRFPAQVAVTIHDLDRNTCVDATRVARRIEGLAVIELEGYGSPEECGGRNDMRWQILP